MGKYVAVLLAVLMVAASFSMREAPVDAVWTEAAGTAAAEARGAESADAEAEMEGVAYLFVEAQTNVENTVVVKVADGQAAAADVPAEGADAPAEGKDAALAGGRPTLTVIGKRAPGETGADVGVAVTDEAAGPAEGADGAAAVAVEDEAVEAGEDALAAAEEDAEDAEEGTVALEDAEAVEDASEAAAGEDAELPAEEIKEEALLGDGLDDAFVPALWVERFTEGWDAGHADAVTFEMLDGEAVDGYRDYIVGWIGETLVIEVYESVENAYLWTAVTLFERDIPAGREADYQAYFVDAILSSVRADGGQFSEQGVQSVGRLIREAADGLRASGGKQDIEEFFYGRLFFSIGYDAREKVVDCYITY